ncbi:MAG: dethiobiotin synthase [Gammaproteobacteria bacterium]|nr:dethiobiotin synthase [Gammaproteobacteria bacterium]
MTKTYFITGTDTEVGKTFVTRLMVKTLVKAGYKVAGLKPIASDSRSGVLDGYQGLINGDAKQLLEASNIPLNYPQVNPLVFSEPIAPHIAAEQSGINLTVQSLSASVTIPDADIVLVEGAGGWLTPLNQTETYADWVAQESMDVIMVVGMKLGCLNHAQLTAQAIKAKGLKLIGWVANPLSPDMDAYQQNLEWLKQNLMAPLLAEVSYQQQDSNFKPQSIVSKLA